VAAVTRTFRGRSAEEALRRVQEAFGEGALIVETRTMPFQVPPPEEPFEVVAVAPAGAAPDEALLRRLGLPPSLRARLRDAGSEREAVRLLARRLPCRAPGRLAGEGGRVLALVGPTGVGKTTTAAKLAARAALDEGARVALVTTDTYRVGAAAQLAAYAEMLGVSFHVAADGAGLRVALEAAREADVVIVDTSGRSPRARAELRAARALLAGGGRPVDVALVVAAGVPRGDFADAVAAFGALRPGELIVTKLDETRRKGGLVSLVRQAACPLSFVSAGQEVPDDLEAAEPEALAEAILGLRRFAGERG
jgi:flagellar biosynthesis protein FlhF